jgi:hypothetical protein
MAFQEQWEAEAETIGTFISGASVDGLRAARGAIEREIEQRGTGTPVRTKVMPDSWYDRLDAGIRFAVRVLHAAGFETGQSCEGGDGHVYDHPTVDLASGTGSDGFAALAALEAYGLGVAEVSIRWGVADGLPTDRCWRLVLRRAHHDRADERPWLVRGWAPEVRPVVAPVAELPSEEPPVEADEDEKRLEIGRARIRAQAELPPGQREISLREVGRAGTWPAMA